MEKYAINSTDSTPAYLFFMPIVNRLWRAHMGYKTISMIVGNRGEWEQHKLRNYVLQKILETSNITIFINHNRTGFKSSTITQVGRLAVAVHPQIKPDDYILTSDVDMLPLNKQWFNSQNMNKKFHLFGANAYLGYIGPSEPGKNPVKFPMCYLGGRKKDWIDIMRITTGTVQLAIEEIIQGQKDWWCLDENLFSNRIKTWEHYGHEKCQFIDRNWSGGRASNRIDRDNWAPNMPHPVYDCHCPRPGPQKWPQINTVLHRFFPKDTCLNVKKVHLTYS
jgi:hypothetical protein